MADEKPYPDMTDDKVLSNLLSISISFLEVKSSVSVTQAKEWGDNLYEVYKYLVGRLGNHPERTTNESEGVKSGDEKEHMHRTADHLKKISRNGRDGHMTVFLDCHIENVTIDEKGAKVY